MDQAICPSQEQPSVALQGLPEHLGSYQLLEKIGEGGMGVVYRARHVVLDKVVAIKLLAGPGADPERVRRFQREMRVISRLDHPHIVRATDGGQIGGVHFLVMDFIEGIDLYRLLREHGPLRPADACELVRQAALGLQHLHEHGLVHRDVKASNLILDRTGTVKVLDLGLARCVAADAAEDVRSAAGQLTGTVDYMAPEQASDAAAVDIRADVYSLGCTLYQLVAGRSPFCSPAYISPCHSLVGRRIEPAPPLRKIRRDAPATVEAVLKRMLAREPADRFASPAEVAAALRPLAARSDLPALLSRAGLAAGTAAPKVPTRWRLAAVLLAVVLLCLAGAAALALAELAGWHPRAASAAASWAKPGTPTRPAAAEPGPYRAPGMALRPTRGLLPEGSWPRQPGNRRSCPAARRGRKSRRCGR
jgi:hypothetical protein